MKKQVFFYTTLISALALLAGCHKDCPSNPDPVKGDPIQFDQLAVGQTSKYIGLLGEKYFESSTDDFVYTDDTLELTVVAKEALGYKIAEKLRYVGDVDSWMAQEKDSTYYYYLSVVNDTLHIIPIGSPYLKSRILSYEIRDSGLPLAEIADPKVQIAGWKTDLPYCECLQSGYAENYALFGQPYDRLNVVVDNRAMAVDGAGVTYAYSLKHGIVRFSTYGWWTQSGYGWDLLPVE